jgi:hypothetical protein
MVLYRGPSCSVIVGSFFTLPEGIPRGFQANHLESYQQVQYPGNPEWIARVPTESMTCWTMTLSVASALPRGQVLVVKGIYLTNVFVTPPSLKCLCASSDPPVGRVHLTRIFHMYYP